MKIEFLKIKHTLIVNFSLILVILLIIFTSKYIEKRKGLEFQIDKNESINQPEIEKFKMNYEYKFPNYDAYWRLFINNKKHLSQNDMLKVSQNLKKLFSDRFIDNEAYIQEMREEAANLKMKFLETNVNLHTKNIRNIKDEK